MFASTNPPPPHHHHHNNHHYSLKLKSMFELAVASSHHHFPHLQNPPQHHPLALPGFPPGPYPATSSQYPPHLPPPSTPQSKPHQQQQHFSNNNNLDSGGTMEETDGGGGAQGYPSSPQSLQKEREDLEESSSSPPLGGREGHNLSFLGGQQQNLSKGMAAGQRKGAGGQQGAGGGLPKASFSIESLLGWRRQQGDTGGGGKSLKETRFTPYPPQPSKQKGVEGVVSGQGGEDKGRQSENSGGVPSSGGSNSSSGKGGGGGSGNGGRRAAKSKRVRTIFTPEQLERLEAEFERQQYMVGPERLYLASSLYLTEAQVKVWFQNRRIKWRKQHLEMEQQRLAIYRTLAEQDMLASGSGGPVSASGGHLGMDEDDDESSSSRERESDVDSAGDEDDYEEATPSQETSPPPKFSEPGHHLPPHPQQQQHHPHPRLRVPLQQSFNLNNEESFLEEPTPQQGSSAPFNLRRGGDVPDGVTNPSNPKK